MTNDIIKPHKFEVAKNKIQKLAHNVPATVEMERFKTEGSIFSWNDHNITGEEANRLLVSPLQSTLIAQNSNIRSLFNIADEVYKALESLDKEYIAGILTSVDAATIASNQAKSASSKAEQASLQALAASQKALEATSKANIAQADIKKTIEGLKMTVRILKEFKEKVALDLAQIPPLNNQISSIKKRIQSVDSKIIAISESVEVLQTIKPYLKGLNHIKDIDVIWDRLTGVQLTINSLIDDTIAPFIKKVNQSDKEIRDSINQLEEFIISISHLADIDTIWSDMEAHKTELAGFHQQVDTFIEKVGNTTERIHNDIAALQQYRSVLEAYAHLGDVDTIWSDVEAHKTELAEFHQQVDNFMSEVKITHSKIKESILKWEEANTSAHNRYEKRIKTAYYIGGTALGLSILNYVLIFLGII